MGSLIATSTGMSVNGDEGITFSDLTVGDVVFMEDFSADPRIAGLNRPVGSSGVDSNGNIYIKLDGLGPFDNTNKNWMCVTQRTALEMERDFLLSKVNFTGFPRWEPWSFSEQDGYLFVAGTATRTKVLSGSTLSTGVNASSNCLLSRGVGNIASTQYPLIIAGDNISWGMSTRFKVNTAVDANTLIAFGASAYAGGQYVVFGVLGSLSTTNFIFRNNTVADYYITSVPIDTNWHIFRVWRRKGASNGTTSFSLDGVEVTPPNAANLYPSGNCALFCNVQNDVTAADRSMTVSWVASLTER